VVRSSSLSGAGAGRYRGGRGHHHLPSAFQRGNISCRTSSSSWPQASASAKYPVSSSWDESSDENDTADSEGIDARSSSSDESSDEETPTIRVANNGAHVTIQFRGDDDGSDDEESGDGSDRPAPATFHASWLWSNDPQRIHLPSGQRTSYPGQWRDHSRPRIRDAKIIYCNIEPNEKAGFHGVHTTDRYFESTTSSDIFISSEKGLEVPGPTLEDSCHPLPVYGDYPAWMTATIAPTTDVSQTRAATTSSNDGEAFCRPYLQIVWSSPSTSNLPGNNSIQESTYDMEWLRKFRYDNGSRLRRLRRTEVRPVHAVRRDGPPSWYATPASQTEMRSLYAGEATNVKHASDGLMHVDYGTIIGEDGEVLREGLFRLLHSVFRDGAAVVSNTPFSHHHSEESFTMTCDNNDSSASQICHSLETMPDDDLPVSRVARAMSGGSLSHGSLYDDIFHVRVGERDGNNVAYTSTPLCPHQDMAYYESPPGVQLLHCAVMGTGVVGGESTLIDGMAAAYRLRELKPASFEALAQCPATFVKQRDRACMTYRRPHISLSEEGIGGLETTTEYREITAVHWSPPFEGPVCLPPRQVDHYYEAYADFASLLDTGDDGRTKGSAKNDDDELSCYAREFTWERKLRPGEMLVFNNRRMLHGRRGFSALGGASFAESQRHLVGCYTNIDDTLNQYRVLLRERGCSTSILNVGNGTNIIP